MKWVKSGAFREVNIPLNFEYFIFLDATGIKCAVSYTCIMTTLFDTRMSDNTKPRQTREKTDKYIQIKNRNLHMNIIIKP